MEALAAVALAGNVLQFLESGTKFTVRALKIIRNGANGGSRSDLDDLRQTSRSFKDQLEQLHGGQKGEKPSTLVPASPLASLSNACSEIIEELLGRLDRIGVNNSHTRVDKLLEEFRSAWHQEEIESLERRIGRFRDQLAVLWIAEIRELAFQSVSDQKLLLSAFHKNVKSGITGNLEDPPGKQMMDSLSRSLPKEAEQHQLNLLRDQMQARLLALDSPPDNDAIVAPEARQFQLPPATKARLQAAFTHSFNFREREFRESSISSPYDKTFQWIFKDDPARKHAGFRQWLASPQGKVFWVTGKPGAGKSTLMKFISQGDGAKLCRGFLAEGAGSSQIATASFYFWASGSEIQASQTALLRTLLFDLLWDPLRDPTRADLISRIAPAMWESACLLGTSFPTYWAEGELRDLLFRTIRELSRDNTRVCLFIDGLDEFGGEPQTIIDFVSKILELPNVKLCVSSRPWVSFECAFIDAPTLRVQDLTYPDIHHFVKSRFDKCEDFSRLAGREAVYAAKLINQVVEKSSGVFLWVRIVVASLITGISNHDTVADLKRRLVSLPPELDDLYARILDFIDPFYFARASRYFQLLLANDGSAEALLLSFADEDKGFCLTLPSAVMSRDERSARMVTLGRRLSSSCKGLLEIGSNGRVSFLHRTLQEFLVRAENWEKVETATIDFDPYLQLSSGFYCLMKTTAIVDCTTSPGVPLDSVIRENQDDFTRSSRWFIDCLKRASRVTGGKHHMVAVLVSLGNFLKALPHLRRRLTDEVALCTDDPIEQHGWLFVGKRLDKLRPLSFTYGGDLLPFAIRFGVTDYVRAQVQSRTTHYKNSAYMSAGARLWQFLFKHNIQSHNNDQEPFGASLFLNACLLDPPDPKMFKVLLDYHGSRGTLNSILRHPNMSPLTFGASLRYSIELDGLSMLEVIVGVALLSSLARDPTIRSQTWRQWVPVLQLFTTSGRKLGRKLDIRVAKRVAKRFHIYDRNGTRHLEILVPEDLVEVFKTNSVQHIQAKLKGKLDSYSY